MIANGERESRVEGDHSQDERWPLLAAKLQSEGDEATE
jgi:hypothetical protein